jgi:AraC-like DNA-binding protein
VAKERLREGHQPIAEIAYEVGYEAEAAFNRAFKREFGIPPAAWRKQTQPTEM